MDSIKPSLSANICVGVRNLNLTFIVAAMTAKALNFQKKCLLEGLTNSVTTLRKIERGLCRSLSK